MLAIVPLLWASRSPALGTPIADDYTFLAQLLLHPPLDWLGPMGPPYYWRPLGRQLYFTILGPVLLEQPWVATAVHGLLFVLLAVVLYGIARRRFAPPVAAGLASFPLLGEPSRVLLAWPSGAQNLLAVLAVALAVHETLAGRRLTATLAALAGVLSHEAASLVLPVLPALAWWRTRRWADLAGWAGIALGVAAVEVIGHAIARTHGMGLPSDAVGGTLRPLPLHLLPMVAARSVAAQLNFENLSGFARGWQVLGYLGLLGLPVALAVRRAARRRLRAAAPTLIGGVLWFLAGLLPLLWVWPDWNGWRTTMPGLGLGLALVSLLAAAWPPLVAGLVALRLTALLAAPHAPESVSPAPPASVSELSFTRLVRLQRTVESTRRAMRARFEAMPTGTNVRYWGIPLLTEYGFQGPLAVTVWYRDSTLRWGPLGGLDGVTARKNVVIEYLRDAPWPARIVEPQALHLFAEAIEAMRAGQGVAADSLLAQAERAQPRPGGPLHSSLMYNRALLARDRGHDTLADRLNRACLELDPGFADAWALAASLALRGGDRGRAVAAVSRCLAINPDHDEGRKLAALLVGPP